MAEFCKCGSIIINNQCTNKNCASRTSGKVTSPAKKSIATAKEKKETKKNPRRASKVITYNLYDTDAEKPE